MKLHKKGLHFAGFSAILCVLFALLFLVGEGVAAGLTKDLDALNAGERWSATGEPYATLTLHTDTENALSRSQIENYAYSIDNALLNESIESAENASVWTYCYYTEDVISVTGPKATASLRIMATGGSFYTFHPLDFLYGAPYVFDKALPDGVVLDEDAAWRIFGAIDVVGMTVEINGREMTVTGIVQKERTTDGYEKAYGDIPRLYMSYYGYENIYGENSNITTFEATLPDPVKSFAKNIFKTAVSINEDHMVLRENSDRYSLVNRFNRMRELRYMGMRNDSIVYPYFENELQVVDYTTSVWMIAQTIAGACAILTLLSAIIALFASGFSISGVVKLGWKKAEKSWEKRHAEKRRKKRKHKKRRSKPNEPTTEGRIE